MRSRPNTSFDWAKFSGGHSSFYDATFSTAKSFDPVARNNCVFDWTRPSDADGETVHRRPS